jgi:hypothetical protein
MNQILQLISLYCYVSDEYHSTVKAKCQRLSNNHQPEFTDEECITVYLWGMMNGHCKEKDTHKFVKEYHLRDFPKLPSYQKFNKRLNNLADAIIMLTENLTCHREITELNPIDLIDSCPIVVANAKRHTRGKVAADLCSSGYCASKGMYYYGVKLHTIGRRRTDALPLPVNACLTPASTADITAFIDMPIDKSDRVFLGDMAYLSKPLSDDLAIIGSAMVTPCKRAKGQKQLSDQQKAFSKAVSKIRQPIDAFFAWLDVKFSIEYASRVRSTNGLLVHVFGRLLLGMLFLIFNW